MAFLGAFVSVAVRWSFVMHGFEVLKTMVVTCNNVVYGVCAFFVA